MSQVKQEPAPSADERAKQMPDLTNVLQGARGALDEGMARRMSALLDDSLALLDRLNRSGIERALPAITQLVENGDLERLVHLARVFGSAEDALNDDMAGRLSATVGDSLVLLDRLNRGGIERTLPAITQLVENGDLERLVHLARVFGSAEDALNEEMIGRLAGVAAEAMCLLDQLTRNNALVRVLEFAQREEVQVLLLRFGEALLGASKEYRQQPPPKGGLRGLLRILTQPANQEALRFFGLFGKHLRDQHR